MKTDPIASPRENCMEYYKHAYTISRKYNDIFPLLKIDFDKYEKNTYTLKGKSIYDHGYYYVLDKEYLKKMKELLQVHIGLVYKME